MTPAAEQLSAELASELASNQRRLRDTRSIPLRFHHLKAMARSPLHCLHAMQSDSEPTLSKRLGAGTHSLLLGGDPVVCFPGKQRRGKVWDAFAKKHAGSIILSRSEYDKSNRIAESVRGNKLASEVLYAPGSIYEHRIAWDWNGRACRSTPDCWSPDFLAELKTTRDASADRFKWDALRYGYVSQLRFYRTALKFFSSMAVLDAFARPVPPQTMIVAVESAPPYVCSVYSVSKRDLEFGEKQIRGWMERFLACEAAQSFPGYCESIQPLELPIRDGEDETDLDLIFGDPDEAEQGGAE